MKLLNAKNAFAALDDAGSSDSEEEKHSSVLTPSTMTPRSDLPQDRIEDLQALEEEAVDPSWGAVKRKVRPVKTAEEKEAAAARARELEAAQSAQAGDSDEDCDSAFYMRKGHRHNWSKNQKQEWSHKAKERLTCAKEKRNNQRSMMMASVVEE
eukprot:TRINITY_DN23803_c0_g1_i1.p2 TRINITY_DN23803_c0_g1~~TRINITY_DN23803_c0_g1_i1.p2  ORF type:complete len:178 (+),score=53.71 TRINITY_DN23803_c0_g1_i1:75-536(+)